MTKNAEDLCRVSIEENAYQRKLSSEEEFWDEQYEEDMRRFMEEEE